MITVLAGGVGAARLLSGLVQVVDAAEITAIVNTGDDFTLHGLRICPDLDTIRYTLAGDVGSEGWGRGNESWTAMQELATVARCAPAGSRATAWFRLGDRDLATHLYRTQRLAEGATLSTVSGELCEAAGVRTRLLPMTDDDVATTITLADGDTIDFQEYFVGRRHAPPVEAVEFTGAGAATAAPGVIDAIASAERLVIAPSNPILSIAPLLAVPGIADAIRNRRERTIAVSPIIDGRAVKGPAAHLLTELGHDASVSGIARLWRDLATALVIDLVDEQRQDSVEREGMRSVMTSTLMRDQASAKALADDIVHLALD